MFKIRYKSHHDVGNVISKFTKKLKLESFTSQAIIYKDPHEKYAE